MVRGVSSRRYDTPFRRFCQHGTRDVSLVGRTRNRVISIGHHPCVAVWLKFALSMLSVVRLTHEFCVAHPIEGSRMQQNQVISASP
jgi:hypothetical protein